MWDETGSKSNQLWSWNANFGSSRFNSTAHGCSKAQISFVFRSNSYICRSFRPTPSSNWFFFLFKHAFSEFSVILVNFEIWKCMPFFIQISLVKLCIFCFHPFDQPCSPLFTVILSTAPLFNFELISRPMHDIEQSLETWTRQTSFLNPCLFSGTNYSEKVISFRNRQDSKVITPKKDDIWGELRKNFIQLLKNSNICLLTWYLFSKLDHLSLNFCHMRLKFQI